MTSSSCMAVRSNEKAATMFNPADPRRMEMLGGNDRLIFEYGLDVEITLWQARGDYHAVEWRRFGEAPTLEEFDAPNGVSLSVLRRIALRIDPLALSDDRYPELNYLRFDFRHLDI